MADAEARRRAQRRKEVSMILLRRNLSDNANVLHSIIEAPNFMDSKTTKRALKWLGVVKALRQKEVAEFRQNLPQRVIDPEDRPDGYRYEGSELVLMHN